MVLTVTFPFSLAKGGVTTRRMCALGRQDAPNLPPLASTECRQSYKTDRGATDSISHLHFSCPCRCSVGGAITVTKPHHLANPAAIGPIERDCQGWLQQTPSHSRDRIRKRRSLPLFRHPAFRVSRPDVGGIKSALLRFQYQETLSFGSGSTEAKGTALDAAETFERL